MQLFHRPSLAHEGRRQPVEQFRIRWLCTGQSEVIRCADEALAKMLLPDAINDYARRQRIAGRDNPVSQGGASAARLWTGWLRDWRGIRIENGKKSGSHGFLRLIE